MTKDNLKVRVKTVFVLIRRVGTSIKSATREKARELIDAYAKDKTFEDLVRAVISGELQQLVKKECSKISPLGNIEIRKSEIIPEKKEAAAQPATVEVPAETH